MKYKDLKNKRFGKLIAISFHHKEFKKSTISGQIMRSYYWLFKCDCGKMTIKKRSSVTCGATQSCGCIPKGKNLNAGESSFNKLFFDYKASAKFRKLYFELTKKQFKKLTSSSCSYCGAIPSKEAMKGRIKRGKYIYNGIDRLNRDKGYTIENCVPCCSICNYAKRKLNKTDFVKYINDLIKNFSMKRVKDYVA